MPSHAPHSPQACPWCGTTSIGLATPASCPSACWVVCSLILASSSARRSKNGGQGVQEEGDAGLLGGLIPHLGSVLRSAQQEWWADGGGLCRIPDSGLCGADLRSGAALISQPLAHPTFPHLYPFSPGACVGSQLQGCALTAGLVSAALTAAGLLGNGEVFALSSLLASAMALLLGTVRGGDRGEGAAPARCSRSRRCSPPPWLYCWVR